MARSEHGASDWGNVMANYSDEEDDEDLWAAIREQGRLVGRQEWDSGGPGAGAGTVDVYLYCAAFYSDNDVDAYGPFRTFLEAANATGLFHVNEATTKIWVDREFSDHDVAALNAQAAELRRQHEEERRRPKRRRGATFF